MAFEGMYLDLSDAVLRNQLPKSLGRMPVFQDAALPDSVAKYPQFLRDAASYHLRIREPFRSVKARVLPTVDFRRHLSRWASLVLNAIDNGEANGASVAKVLSYYEILCGCGRERSILAKTQTAASLLLMVRVERWDEAVGAALCLRGSSAGAESVLFLAGIDGEKSVAGELALEAASAPSSRRRLIGLLNELLLCPGDGRVDTLVGLAQAAPPDQLPLYIQALEKFLKRNPEPERPKGAYQVFRGGWGSAGGEYLTSTAIPPVRDKASRRALMFLSDLASPTLSNKAALALVKAFDRRYLEESYPALRKLLGHPAGGVVRGAEWALSDAGQEADSPEIVSSVRYRLLVNGRPLKKFKLDVVVVEEAGWSIRNDITDGEGFLEVGRDPFVDPQFPAQDGLIKNLSMPKREDLIFARMIKPIGDESGVRDINISAYRLRLRLEIPRLGLELTGREMRVSLTGPRLNGSYPFEYLSYWFDGPAGEIFEFPQLASGEYELEVSVPGCAWWTGRVQVDADREITIGLQRGSDLEYQLISSAPGAKSIIRFFRTEKR